MFNLITCKATKKAVGTNQTAFLRIRTHPPSPGWWSTPKGSPNSFAKIQQISHLSSLLQKMFCNSCIKNKKLIKQKVRVMALGR